MGSVPEMERKEILEKLKTTETEIRESIEAAQHKRNEILAQAQKQAQKLEDDAEQKRKADREKLLAAAKEEIEKNRQRALKKAQSDADTLKKKAQIKKAKEFFIKKFTEYMHV
jgi:vacuolar-type H+-ATPase subunit H